MPLCPARVKRPAPGAQRARSLCACPPRHGIMACRCWVCLQMSADKLMRLAEARWSAAARASPEALPAFEPALVERIYQEELGGGASTRPPIKRVMLLEVSAGAARRHEGPGRQRRRAPPTSACIVSVWAARAARQPLGLLPRHAWHLQLRAPERRLPPPRPCPPQVSQYLEGYLLPHFDESASSDAHVLSMVLMINAKFREGVPAWAAFHAHKVHPRPPPPDNVAPS